MKRKTNCGKVVIKEKPVNRGGDFGLEILCEYSFEGDNLSCKLLHRNDTKQQPYTVTKSDCQLHKYSTV